MLMNLFYLGSLLRNLDETTYEEASDLVDSAYNCLPLLLHKETDIFTQHSYNLSMAYSVPCMAYYLKILYMLYVKASCTRSSRTMGF